MNTSLLAAKAVTSKAAGAGFHGERVLTHNLIVGAGTMVAGALGVAFQVTASHQLRPADYGGVFAVVTLITLLGLPASAFTLLMARSASRDKASGDLAASSNLLRGGTETLLIAGIALAILVAGSSSILGTFLQVPAVLILVAAAGLPFGMALPLLLGDLQGEQRFVAFSSLAVGQAGLKLGAAVAFGLVWGPVGVIAGISIASALIYVIAFWLVRGRFVVRVQKPWWRSAVSYSAVVLPSTLCLALLLSTDVLLAKHYLGAQNAGEYGAVAAIGRAIFWGATGVATVLFPKMSFRGAQGRSGASLVAASLGLVGVGGLAGLAVLSIGAKALLTAFAGSAYASAAGYLPWYAVGMTLLGGAAVLIAAHQSSGKPAFLAVLIPITLLEPGLIVAFHQGPGQIVQVLDVSMAVLLVGLGALFLAQQRERRIASFAFAGTGSIAREAVGAGVGNDC